MADCYGYGGRTVYSSTDECHDVGKHGSRIMMYSNTDECYDVGKHGSRRMHSHADDCYDGSRRPAAYADDGCYDGARQTAVYSDEYSRGGYGGEQQYYKREEKEHKNRERLGEVGALAGGAFALYEGHRATKDPEHKQKHMIEAGLAGAAALGAGGYAYHEHREQKEARYEISNEHTVPHGYYCN